MLHLYNTLSRNKEEFKPIKGKKVGLYTCGPTVYNFAHIGNLRTYIFEDLLRRTLEKNGYVVNHVMNITDVGHLTDDADAGEDKMEAGAKREKKTVWEIADEYTKAFQDNMADLNLHTPDIWCKATDHIQEQIDLVKQIETNGYAYVTSDGVYFDSVKFKDYGKMAKLDIAGLQEGARIDKGEKKNSTDFALWKFSPKDEQRQMEWDSPWGKGFPGWHLECSAMSMKYLGDHFDIHCGGIDHIPVHHTNEIAQNEAAVGKKTVNYWLHGEFLLTNDDRMGKSKGNFLTLQALKEKGYDPLAYRYFAVSSHYRSKLNFTFEALDGAVTALNKLRHLMTIWDESTEQDEAIMEKFMMTMNDDLDTPKAVAIMWDMTKLENIDPGKKLATLLEMDLVLGLGLQSWFDIEETQQAEVPPDITELVQARETARAAKEWNLADELREKISQQGYEIEDTTDGSRIYKA
ncbi:MAG: cysteine--tRNA ligase [bacterium]|nr:cysteine--tRNA ligase [bacterium]